MLAAAGSFALGIALMQLCRAAPLGSAIPLLLSGAAACMLAGVALLRRPDGSPASAPRRSAVCGVFVLAGFLLAGAAAGALFEYRFPPGDASRWEALGVDVHQPVELTGYLVSSPLRSSELQFDLEATSVESGGQTLPTSGKVRLWVEAPYNGGPAALDALHLAYGDSLRAEVRLRQPRVYLNPGAFDFRRRMREIEDVYWEGTIRNPGSLEKLPGNHASWPGRLVERTRRRLLDGIDRLYPPWSLDGRVGAVLKAVLLGDRSALDSDTVESFRQSGLYHLLVIAGLHIGLLAMLLAGLLRLMGLRGSWRSALLLVLLLAYACLVEQRAPTLRATLMIVVWLFAGMFDRTHTALNAIGVAALALAASRPAWLFESGFDLSFAAALLIAGIAAPVLARTTEPYRNALFQLPAVERDAALAPRLAQLRLDLRALIVRLERRFAFLGRHPAWASAFVTWPVRGTVWTVNIVLFSAILQLGLLLPMVETFHRVTFAGIGLNALAIPLMTALLALALPTVLLGATLPALAAVPARLLSFIVNMLFALARLPREPGWLSYRVPTPPLWVAFGFAISIIVAAVAVGRSRLALFAASAMFALFATLLCGQPFAARLPAGVIEATALDCGGGDSLFLVLPDRTTALVGACGAERRPYGARGEGVGGAVPRRSWDPGESIVSPYLWSRGVKRIDVLVLPDTRGDHVAGFTSVIDNFRVGELWHGPVGGSARGSGAFTNDYAALLEEADRRGVRVRQVMAGDGLEHGAASLQVLWPPASGGEPSPGSSGSLALRAASGEASVLAPGDVNGSTEAGLLGLGAALRSAVLKLPAARPEQAPRGEFLARVQPRVAIVTGSGPASADPGTLARLAPAGAQVFRTDLDGAITVVMKDSSLAVHTYRESLRGAAAAPTVAR